ncbi:hypothetical protein PACTADRAFT_3717 [Pachysolen tannophilus NRRL Y-2460]|uniref:AAA+ ATPase domain-containing protein n=1 Tax=Pachysolen tannophilus NRRL Y-2460 TaxID=669874 RepID=A0A1E4TSW0_PACTA|nr:hypothetical protein PACTADRAFT_3717 [Pachysolen tannophilus NRRL Y-2460]
MKLPVFTTPGKAYFCTIISAFGVLILSVLAHLFSIGHESMMGSTSDPSDGKAAASTLWKAVIVYAFMKQLMNRVYRKASGNHFMKYGLARRYGCYRSVLCKNTFLCLGDQRRQLANVVGSGPQGCNNRFPIPETIDSQHMCLTITDPLIVYQNYVANGTLKPDQEQFRAAVEFQKLYLRVRDYSAPADLKIRINKIVRDIEQKHEKLNAMDKKFGKYKPRWFDTDLKRTELVKVLTDEEELVNFPSPQGLLINGPVGSGKSLLMDIFASSLPHKSKCRWHYNNFMLWVYNEIHQIYKRRMVSNQENHSLLSLENEFILFEVAEKMISKNTILLLDEFMLPDLAAANIVKILFTYFFKLGGVLVATSNRLPEDLYSNDFRKNKFKNFLDVLKIKCHSYDMTADKDYRSILTEEAKGKIEPYIIVKSLDSQHDTHWENLLNSVADMNQGNSENLEVYGHILNVPWASNGTVKYDFQTICQGLYGPGDYISLASNYHTFILDNVPVMTLKMKNEARRFITLLDALYEAKCKLIMRSDVDIDQLFFPEISRKDNGGVSTNSDSNIGDSDNRIEVQNEEMFSKTSMDLANPYRPNVSSYSDGNNDFENIPGSCKFQTNFKNLKQFTGEDEMFAYKRAVSRIKEMTGSPNWRLEGKWTPIDKSMRPWEKEKEQLEKGNSNPEHVTYSIGFEIMEDFKNDNRDALSLLSENIERGKDANLNTSNSSKEVSGEKISNSPRRSIQEISNDMIVRTLPPDYSDLKNHDNIFPFSSIKKSKAYKAFQTAPVIQQVHFWAMGVWNQSSKFKDDITRKWIKGYSEDYKK